MMTSNESYLLRKERCPRCASNGKDTSADNLSVWSDGHVYCFACGYRKRGIPQLDTIGNAKSGSSVSHKEKKSRQNSMYKSLPTEAKQYLVSQGLTEKEIAKYHFHYDPNDGSIICPIYNDKNEEVMKVKRYNWKDFDPKMPKYRCIGKKPYTPLVEKNNWYCIVVEDMISAIHLSRFMVDVIPLFGTKLPKYAALTLAKKYDRMYVWLDRDKAVDAVRMSRRWNYFFKEGSKVIVTDYDPKQYTDDEIGEILYNHCHM